MTCEPWSIEWTCDVSNVDPTRLQLAADMAQALLWQMAAGRIGVCEYTEQYRPICGSDCIRIPYKDASGWHNGFLGFAECCRILLDHRPVIDVASVSESGVEIDSDSYAVENGYLRKRGSCWGCAPSCSDPTLEVTYTAGIAPPLGTELALGEVGCEFLAALDNRPCKLPSRAVSVIRQGVTIDLGSPTEFRKAGRLGLPIADAWLDSIGAGTPRSRSKVYSPDLARAIR